MYQNVTNDSEGHLGCLQLGVLLKAAMNIHVQVSHGYRFHFSGTMPESTVAGSCLVLEEIAK